MTRRMLSPFERACLRWVSKGKTRTEIAQLEGKSENEIEGYLRSALISLEAKS